MSRIWRIAVMWLLALALPAQGFAAASMLNCGPGHHGAVSGEARADHDHGAHPHDEATAADADAGEAGDNVASSGPEVASAHGIHKDATGSCSACASCCTTAAPPLAASAFEAASVPGAFQPLAPPGVAAFLTDGPQRPPRSFLA